MKKILILTLLSPMILFGQSLTIEEGFTSFEILPSGMRSLKGTSMVNNNVTLGYANTPPFLTSALNNVKFGAANFVNNYSGSGSIAIGGSALNLSTSGINNIAIGTANLEMLTIDSSNTAIGDGNWADLISGGYNIGIGYKNGALVNTASGNIALGNQNFRNTLSLGDDNIAFGEACLYNNTGSTNIGFGQFSLYSNTTGSNNIAFGNFSLDRNISGNSNIGIGHSAAQKNISGDYNIAIGYLSLLSNTAADNNISIGENTLASAVSSSNIGIGRDVLQLQNSTSNRSIAIGTLSQRNLTTGKDNVSVGFWSGSTNSTGNRNNSMGSYALFSNTASDNIGIGHNAGDSHASGDGNLFVGAFSDDASTSKNISNSAAIGYGATVTSNNTYVLGNASIASIGGYANWSNFSDRRLKENIIYCNDLGLDFIKALKTATYTYKEDETGRVLNGLIAQDVQATLSELGLSWGGLTELDDEQKTLAIAYGQLTIPLINATQELKAKYGVLQSKLQQIKAENEKLERLNLAYEQYLSKQADTSK